MNDEILEKVDIRLHQPKEHTKGRHAYLKSELFFDTNDPFRKEDFFVATRYRDRIEIRPKVEEVPIKTTPSNIKDRDYGL